MTTARIRHEAEARLLSAMRGGWWWVPTCPPGPTCRQCGVRHRAEFGDTWPAWVCDVCGCVWDAECCG